MPYRGKDFRSQRSKSSTREFAAWVSMQHLVPKSKYCKKEMDAGLKSEEDLLNFSQIRHSGAEVAMQGKHWKITNALSPRLLPLHVSQRKKDMLPLILPGLTRGNQRRYIPGLEYMQKSCSYCVPVDLQGWHYKVPD